MIANSVKSQFKLVYKHILISLILVFVLISISFIILNELHFMFFLLPAVLLFVLMNLVWDAYQANRVVSLVFLLFILTLIYSNVTTRRDEQRLRGLFSLLSSSGGGGGAGGLTSSENVFYMNGGVSSSSRRRRLGLSELTENTRRALALNGSSNTAGAIASQQELNSGSGSSSGSSYNIFFVETNLMRARFSTKQMCAIESAAAHNAAATVYVVSIRAVVDDALLFRAYRNIVWVRLMPNEVFADTPLHDWWLSGRVLKSQFMVAHLSDAVRLALLWKYGGFYSDLDTITIKTYAPLLGLYGAGYLNGRAPSLANGFLHFGARHPFLALIMDTFARDYNPDIWGHNGPILLRRMMQQYCNVADVYTALALGAASEAAISAATTNAAESASTTLAAASSLTTSTVTTATTVTATTTAADIATVTRLRSAPSAEIQTAAAVTAAAPAKAAAAPTCGIYVYPQDFFYPYNNYQLSYLFDKRSLLNVSAFVSTYSVHFYGKVSSKYQVQYKDSSVYEHFASSHCEIVYSGLKFKNKTFT